MSRRYARMMKRGIEPREHDVQAAFVELININVKRYPVLAISFAIVNAQKMLSRANNPGALIGFLRAEGFREGVPDWVLPWPAQGYHGLWIEFKRGASGQVSPAQRHFISDLRLWGHRVEVMQDAELAWDCVRHYLADGYKLKGG